MDENIYQQNGYDSRQQYLEDLADQHGIKLDVVLAVSDVLGECEDFDGLPIALQDGERMNMI